MVLDTLRFAGELSVKRTVHPIDDPRPEDDVRQELQTRHSH